MCAVCVCVCVLIYIYIIQEVFLYEYNYITVRMFLENMILCIFFFYKSRFSYQHCFIYKRIYITQSSATFIVNFLNILLYILHDMFQSLYIIFYILIFIFVVLLLYKIYNFQLKMLYYQCNINTHGDFEHFQ